MMSLTKLAAMAAILTMFAGCNTVAGAGKDVERGGEKVQELAKDTQKKN